MTLHASDADSRQPMLTFDFSNIFIAREQQLDLFDVYLNRWKRLMEAAALTAAHADTTAAPSPNNQIQGFVVLLYGRGGFGKSTLLRHFRDMALEPARHLAVSEIIDWEFALDESNRSIFNPPPGQQVDADGYFRVLRTRLAQALAKSPDQFREYNKAVKELEQDRKEAGGVIEALQKDDRFAWLRRATSQEAIALVRTFVPAVNAVPGIDTIAGAAQQGIEQGMRFGAEEAKHLHEKLRSRLGHRLDDCLDSSLKLGLSLGRDLARFARDFPLLICLDTYEIVDEGDRLLRIVMGAAGVRVGWILAGRDNLWAGVEQRKRSQGRVYGYKDIVPPDRALAIDFNVGSIGAFTGNDILTYFTLLSEKAPERLAAITEDDAERILEATQGVPLAVKIAAALYWETTDLEIIIAKSDGKREIVDQMVLRYLQHAQDDQQERARLYGLALLRRADQPAAIAAALGLSPEQAETRYESELSRLHRRYSFVFTEKAQPSLHQEVRHFLRLWLLENHRNPEVVAVNKRLKAAHEAALQIVEARWQDGGLRERMEDDEWAGIYLDLVEQQYWLDCAEGARACLPFMLAAAIYRRDANKEAAAIGNFFAGALKHPYRNWWKWVDESLVYTSSKNPSAEELSGLEELVKLANQRCPTFPAPVPDYRPVMEAALWWRLGEAFEGKDDHKALEWYEKALTRLGKEMELREAAAGVCFKIAYKLYDEKKYAECLPFWDRAIDLKPDYIYAYGNRGNAYADLKDYPRAIADFDRAIALDPNLAIAYNNRGLAYDSLKDYPRAIADYDRAIELDPNYANAYNNRGNAYDSLKDYPRAIADFDRAIALDPNLAIAYNNRGLAYADLKDYPRAIADYDRAIELDPNDAAAYSNRGNAYANLKDYPRAIADFDRAIVLDPNYTHAYYNRGNAYDSLKDFSRAIADYDQALALDPNDAIAYHNRGVAYLGLKDTTRASADFKHSLKLDPTNVNAGWMAKWTGMGKERVGAEMAERLERIAEINLQDYIAYVCRGLALALRGQLREGLAEIEQAISQEPAEWDPYFWKGMICAYLGRNAAATEAIEKALEVRLPPVLLRPLYWLERDRPDFFREYARPLLERYEV